VPHQSSISPHVTLPKPESLSRHVLDHSGLRHSSSLIGEFVHTQKLLVYINASRI